MGFNDSVIALRLLINLYWTITSSCMEQSTKAVFILTEPKLLANSESSCVCGQQTYIVVTFPRLASHINTMEGGVTKEGSASSGMCKYGNTRRSRYDTVGVFFTTLTNKNIGVHNIKRKRFNVIEIFHVCAVYRFTSSSYSLSVSGVTNLLDRKYNI